MKVMEGFDIGKYITAADIVSAVAAGTIAYLTYKTKQDEPTPKQPRGQADRPARGATTGSPPSALQFTDDQWVKEFERVIYGKGFVVQGGSAGKQVAAKLCQNLITHTNITNQELQTLLSNPTAIQAMVRNYGSLIYTSDKDIGKYTRYFMTFMRQGMSLEDAATKAGRLGGIHFS